MSGAFVMAAPNGARRTKADHPALPMTAAELAEEARRCRDAGAAALHVHVRDSAGLHTLDADLYREAIDAVRDAVGEDLVLQITTEAVGRFTPEEQMASVRAVRPEAVSVALREILPRAEIDEPVRDFFAWMHEERIWVQIILYDEADVSRFVELHDTGLFAARHPSAILVLGRYTAGQRSRPEDLDVLLDALAPERPTIPWAVCAFGPLENACVARAFAEGGHGRVGFENNLYLPDGTLAPHTSDLVRLAVEAARDAGRVPMDAAQLRRDMAAWL